MTRAERANDCKKKIPIFIGIRYYVKGYLLPEELFPPPELCELWPPLLLEMPPLWLPDDELRLPDEKLLPPPLLPEKFPLLLVCPDDLPAPKLWWEYDLLADPDITWRFAVWLLTEAWPDLCPEEDLRL
jgi:hypothetical protein